MTAGSTTDRSGAVATTAATIIDLTTVDSRSTVDQPRRRNGRSTVERNNRDHRRDRTDSRREQRRRRREVRVRDDSETRKFRPENVFF